MSAACVCMVDGKWRCGVHGVIDEAKRAAARGRVGPDTFTCCGSPCALGHDEQCDNYQPPVEVHTDQESLL